MVYSYDKDCWAVETNIPMINNSNIVILIIIVIVAIIVNVIITVISSLSWLSSLSDESRNINVLAVVYFWLLLDVLNFYSI